MRESSGPVACKYTSHDVTQYLTLLSTTLFAERYEVQIGVVTMSPSLHRVHADLRFEVHLKLVRIEALRLWV